jgi:hypothetical protein
LTVAAVGENRVRAYIRNQEQDDARYDRMTLGV